MKSGYSSTVPARSEGGTQSFAGMVRQTSLEEQAGEQRLGSGLRSALVKRAVKAPVLLIVGAEDHGVIELNVAAREDLQACESELDLVPRATHLFEEPGALEAVARLAADWFGRNLAPTPASAAPRATRR